MQSSRRICVPHRTVLRLRYMTQRERMEKILSDPAYRGLHVVVVADRVFTAKTGEGAATLLKEADEKFPDDIAAVTYIPDADTLILWL